jgi:hypothetical protein
MLAIIFWIGLAFLRWSFVAACVLAYVEVGPGGEALGNVIEAFKGILLSIDWESLVRSVSIELEKVVKAFFESAIVREEV